MSSCDFTIYAFIGEFTACSSVIYKGLRCRSHEILWFY